MELPLGAGKYGVDVLFQDGTLCTFWYSYSGSCFEDACGRCYGNLELGLGNLEKKYGPVVSWEYRRA